MSIHFLLTLQLGNLSFNFWVVRILSLFFRSHVRHRTCGYILSFCGLLLHVYKADSFCLGDHIGCCEVAGVKVSRSSQRLESVRTASLDFGFVGQIVCLQTEQLSSVIFSDWLWASVPRCVGQHRARPWGPGSAHGASTPASETTGNQFVLCELQDIEAKKEAQKEKEIDEQEANASTFHRSRTPLDKDLINTGIYESSGKQCLPLVQLIQQLLR